MSSKIVRAVHRPIAMSAISGAIANVGVQESGGENRGKYVEAYQQSCVPPIPPGSPWCAAFVRFRMKHAATSLGMTYDSTFPRSGYTPDWSNWAKKNNKWIAAGKDFGDGVYLSSVILPGDIALFYFKALGRIGHIGLIEKVTPSGLVTIEGNTSPEPEDADEVERDGDGVFRKNREWNELGYWGGILMVDF